MILTVILAPVCILLFASILAQWQRINELKNDARAALAEADGLRQQIAESNTESVQAVQDASEHDKAEIKRQQNEIESLHKKVTELEAELRSRDDDNAGMCGE